VQTKFRSTHRQTVSGEFTKFQQEFFRSKIATPANGAKQHHLGSFGTICGEIGCIEQLMGMVLP
jgi:hypothetical protein